MIASTADVIAPDTAATALASVKYLFVPSAIVEVDSAPVAAVIAELRFVTSVAISPSA